MTERHPRADELLAGAAEYLAASEADESPRAAYLQRVAQACLRIVEREQRIGATNDARQLERLRQLLATDGTLPLLEAELCRRICEREIDASDSRLLCHLDDTAVEHVSIDNPAYSGLREALARRGSIAGDASPPVE